MPQAPFCPGYPCSRKSLGSLVGGVLLLLIFLGNAAFAAGQVELVSRVFPRKASDTASGSAANLIQPQLSVSADGRRVVFLSSANNLVAGETRTDLSNLTTADVFLHDRISGTTTLVSHAAASAVATSDLGAEQAVLSADGRWVAFISQSTDLTDDPAAGPFHPGQLFLFDSVAGTTARISPSVYAQNNNAFGVRELAISADGRFVAFVSDAPDLVPGQQEGNNYLDVFLYDRTTGQTSLVSHVLGSASTTGNSSSQNLSLSADGRFVAFDSEASDLVPGQTGVFLYDRLSGALQAIGPGNNPHLSADGGTVAFLSLRSDVIPGQVDANGGEDLFLYDRASGTATLVSHAAGLATTTASADSFFGVGMGPFLSADGRFVVFLSSAGNLVAGQSVPPSPGQALFLYDRSSGAVTLVSHAAGSPATPGSYGNSSVPSISADGRFVAFQSDARNLVPNQTDLFSTKVFLFDRSSGATSLVSAGSRPPTGPLSLSFGPAISADGSQVDFYTFADSWVDGAKDFNNGEDVILHDIAAGTNAYATLHAPGEPSVTPDAKSSLRGLSADGRFVLYESAAANLVAGQVDMNQGTDVFLRDRATGTNLLVSHAASGRVVAGNDFSSQSVLSADGRYVAFASVATNLVTGVTDRLIQDPVPGEPSNYYDVFLFDRTTGGTTLVSRSATSPGLSAFGHSVYPSLSADGRYVAFVSSATDLVAGFDDADGLGVDDVFLYDRVTQGITLVSRSSANPLQTGDQRSFNPIVSADGNYVVYESEASDLVPGQSGVSGFSHNVFLYDRVAGTNRLVSHTPGSLVDGGSGSVGGASSLSGDGRFVVFSSGNGGLAGSTDEPFVETFYLYDRLSGAVTLAGGSNDIEASPPTLSANGRWVAFLSNAALPPVVHSPQFDQVYLFDRIAGTWTLVTPSAALPGEAGQNSTETIAISANGRTLAFVSLATDLVLGQTGTGLHVFLYDRIAASLAVVEGGKDTPVIFDNVLTPPALLLSANGRQAAFDSYSPDLVPGDYNSRGDVFLFSLDPPPANGPVAVPPCNLLSQLLQSSVRKPVQATGRCGVPVGAKQVITKITATGGTGKGTVEVLQGDVTTSVAGLLLFSRGHSSTASFTVPLSAHGTLDVLPFVRGNGTVKVTVDVDGYFP
jgi:Tol biopolymer transport system component